jgi:hypothetical protein
MRASCAFPDACSKMTPVCVGALPERVSCSSFFGPSIVSIADGGSAVGSLVRECTVELEPARKALSLRS